MNTLEYITNKFNLDLAQKSPIKIPNTGRNNLAEWFYELGFTTGAEIGVCDGTYSEILCKANPNLKLYGVDPFRAYRAYRDYTLKSTIDRYHEAAKARLAPYNCELVEKFSMDAVKDFADNSLDFVYIDGNHEFSYVVADISAWLKKIRPGGIISGHDYFDSKPPTATHVYQAVNGFTDSHRINPWFVLGSDANNEGLIRDKHRSWLWVK